MSDGGTPVLWSEIKSLRAEIEAVRKGDMKALELQAKEYERRLDELNSHRSSMERKYAVFVTRELHDASFARVDKEIATLSRIVYIGLGIMLVAQVLIGAAIQHFTE